MKGGSGAAQSLMEGLKIGRQGAFKIHLGPARRMAKAKRGGVKRLAGKGGGGFGGGSKAGGQAARAAVKRIPHQPMADIGHMDADLMGAPGFQTAFHQRRLPPGKAFAPLHPCHGRPGRHGPAHRLALAVFGMASQARADADEAARFKADPAQARQARIARIRNTVAKGKVMAAQAMGGKLGGEALMGTVGFGHNEKARSVFVDPVDNPGAQPPPHP